MSTTKLKAFFYAEQPTSPEILLGCKGVQDYGTVVQEKKKAKTM
jgi:hypothetical protein